MACEQNTCQPLNCSGDRCSTGHGAGGCCAKTPFCGIAVGAKIKTCSNSCISENRGCGESDCCAGLVCDTGFCTKPACTGASCSLISPCCSGVPYCGGSSTCGVSCVGEGQDNGSESACCIGLASSTGGTCERYPFCAYSTCTQGFAQGGCCAEAPYCTATGNLQGKACLGICGGEGNSCGPTRIAVRDSTAVAVAARRPMELDARNSPAPRGSGKAAAARARRCAALPRARPSAGRPA